MSRAGNPNRPDISQMISLKVDNLSERVSVDALREHFEKCRNAKVGDVYIPMNHTTRLSKGYGFVRFTTKEDAERARDEMDGSMFMNREIRVSLAQVERDANMERFRRRYSEDRYDRRYRDDRDYRRGSYDRRDRGRDEGGWWNKYKRRSGRSYDRRSSSRRRYSRGRDDSYDRRRRGDSRRGGSRRADSRRGERDNRSDSYKGDSRRGDSRRGGSVRKDNKREDSTRRSSSRGRRSNSS